ncbi:MAG: hypothetical protein ABI402_07990 [Ferruginibacter sp.]
MKFFPFIFSFFIIQSSFAQITTNVSWTEHSDMPPNEVIYYKTNNKLQWDNFSGTATKDNSLVAALTVSGFGYNASLKTINGKGELIINVYCYFSKNKSWVKPGRNTPYILNHEQHHFDVSYIAAQLFIAKLQSTKFTINNYQELLARIYNECCDSMNNMQNDYDSQTKNGQVEEEQARWNTLIDSRINKLTN